MHADLLQIRIRALPVGSGRDCKREPCVLCKVQKLVQSGLWRDAVLGDVRRRQLPASGTDGFVVEVGAENGLELGLGKDRRQAPDAQDVFELHREAGFVRRLHPEFGKHPFRIDHQSVHVEEEGGNVWFHAISHFREVILAGLVVNALVGEFGIAELLRLVKPVVA